MWRSELWLKECTVRQASLKRRAREFFAGRKQLKLVRGLNRMMNRLGKVLVMTSLAAVFAAPQFGANSAASLSSNPSNNESDAIVSAPAKTSSAKKSTAKRSTRH